MGGNVMGTGKKETPDVDVPLENQTRECLIALVEAMDKQAKDGEARSAAMETLAFQARRLLKSHKENDASLQMLAYKGLYEAIDRIDALTPKLKKEET